MSPLPEAPTLVSMASTVRVPSHWRNLLADLPQYSHLAEMKLSLASDGASGQLRTHLPKMPLSIARQSMDTENREIPIPEAVRELYALYRPTPLRRARNLEQEIGTHARIYFKFEGTNVAGSHKMNSALAQAYYYNKAGVRHVVTGTGAGQWGTALAFACRRFDLECTVFMPRVSLQQKPQRRVMMELFGARIHESPSELTELGRRIRSRDPDKLGTLAVATGEALELATTRERSQFAVGSGENHVLLHQTVIGQEAQQQILELGDYPDVIFACMGAGSNFAGVTFPFLGDPDHPRPRCVAVEPAACPKMTRGVYAYTETDFSGTTPIAKMMTLGAQFEAPGIHAGGLRYHGTSPLLSAMYADGLFEAVACPQRAVFEAAALFARCEGVLPAPESAHAICAALDEARKATVSRPLSILINISGMGVFDISGYQEYLSGEMEDCAASDEVVAQSLEALRGEQERYLQVAGGPERDEP